MEDYRIVVCGVSSVYIDRRWPAGWQRLYIDFEGRSITGKVAQAKIWIKDKKSQTLDSKDTTHDQ